jgi:signal transduction histidine kinase
MLNWNNDGLQRPDATRTPRERPPAPARSLDSTTLTSAIIRAIPDLMFLLRRDGTYVDYHARDTSQLFVPASQFMGKKISEILPASVANKIMEAIETALDGVEPVVIEYELPIPEVRTFEARVVSAGDDMVLTIVREMTMMKRALALDRELAGRLIAAQEEERARIARDLHDGVCQEMASVAVDVSYLRRRSGEMAEPEVQSMLGAIQNRAAAIAESLRLLSHDLHPSLLHHLGLVSAVQAHCAEVERLYQMRVNFRATGEVDPTDPLTALSLFRIVQESLQNAATHGRAKQAHVELLRDDHLLLLVITDNGQGFDISSARQRGGLGLVSIEERARLSRGQATFRSRPGRSVVEVFVPFDLNGEHATAPNPSR